MVSPSASSEQKQTRVQKKEKIEEKNCSNDFLRALDKKQFYFVTPQA